VDTGVTLIEIDPNVRVTAPDGTVNATRSLLSDADGPVAVGDHVTAYESEDQSEWPARVVAIERGFVYVKPDWPNCRHYGLEA
jgi:hypothetical protein